MSQSFNGWISDVVISNGGTTSRSVRGIYEYDDATAITIQAPATLAESCTFEVSQDDTTFATLHDGTTDIIPPTAGKARQYTELIGWKYWRIKAGSAVGADRTFKVTKQWTV